MLSLFYHKDTSLHRLELLISAVITVLNHGHCNGIQVEVLLIYFFFMLIAGLLCPVTCMLCLEWYQGHWIWLLTIIDFVNVYHLVLVGTNCDVGHIRTLDV